MGNKVDYSMILRGVLVGMGKEAARVGRRASGAMMKSVLKDTRKITREVDKRLKNALETAATIADDSEDDDAVVTMKKPAEDDGE